MFFLNPRKRKIRTFFKIEKTIDLSHADFFYEIDYKTLIKYINISNEMWDNKAISHLMAFLIEKDLNNKILNDDKLKNKILNKHAELIHSGLFDLWNNEFSYHQKESTAISELVAFLVDNFSKKEPVFSKIKLISIKKYFSFSIDFKEIECFQMEDDYFRQHIRKNSIFDTYNFFSELDKIYYNGGILFNDEFKTYDFSIGFEKNLQHAILNYNSFKENMIAKPIDAFTKNNQTIKTKLHIGKFIDFKSLYGMAIFINIPEYVDDYVICLARKQNETNNVDLFLSIYDITNKSDANQQIYSEITAFLSIKE